MNASGDNSGQQDLSSYFGTDEQKMPVSAGTVEQAVNVSVSQADDPFEQIAQSRQQNEPSLELPAPVKEMQPDTLNLASPGTSTAPNSSYATPAAPTPIVEVPEASPAPLGFSSHAVPLNNAAPSLLTPTGGGGSIPLQIPSPSTHIIEASQLNTSSSIDESCYFGLDDDEDRSRAHASDDPEERERLRRLCAWIPCSATVQILTSLNSARSPGNSPSTVFYPDRATLTAPSVCIREDLTDPVRNFVAHYSGESEAQKRQTLTVDSVTQDARGLRQLVKAGCFRAAVNLTGRLLTMYNQGPGGEGNICKHTPASLQIWYIRLALLLKLRQFSVAEKEAEPFGDLDRPDLYFAYYPDMYNSAEYSKTGSIVPFSFRLLVSEIPQYLGKSYETLDRLFAVLAVVRKIILNLKSGKLEDGRVPHAEFTKDDAILAIQLWESREIRTMLSIANCGLMQKDFELSINTLEELLEKEPEEARKPKLISAIARVYLQLGDLLSAKSWFSSAYKLRSPNLNPSHMTPLASDQQVDNFLDIASLAMANGDFSSALSNLRQALELTPDHAGIVNNLAMCYLYMGQLKDGLTFLESQMTSKPSLLLQETPILNLATLYELESSYAGQKKKSLLDLVSQHKGDGINVTCLKLQV